MAVLLSPDAERAPHCSSVCFLSTVRTFLVAIFFLLGDVFFHALKAFSRYISALFKSVTPKQVQGELLFPVRINPYEAKNGFVRGHSLIGDGAYVGEG